MADKATSSSKSTANKDTASGFGATPTSNNAEKVNSLLDQVRDLLVEDGNDYATAEALTNFARQGSPPIVGNLADLQRMGAIAVEGEIPANAMPTGDQTPQQTSNIQDAFAEPPQSDPVNPQPITAEISAAAAKAEEKSK